MSAKKGSSSTSSPNPNITLFDVDGSQEVKEAFELFAGIPKTNFFQKGSGQVEATLERGEVFLALRALGIEVHTDSIPNLIAEVAPEHTQAITLSQFTKIVAKQYQEKDKREELIKAFQLFDDDGTGKIYLKNLRRVAKELGERFSDEELQWMIDEADLDSDGGVSLDEFLAVMKKASFF